MSPSSRSILLRASLVIALLAIGVAGFIGWKRQAVQQAWIAARPALPAAVGANAPGLDARLAACAVRFKDWPPDRTALAEFARVCHANGQLDTAATAYRALINLEPAAPRWPYFLASIFAGYGRLDEALPYLRRTTELAPDYLVAWLKLGDALLKSNAIDDADAAYQQALHRDPANRYALLGLARCDLQAERLTSARSNLQRAVADHPDFASAQSLLGTVFERLGNAEAAAIARSRVQEGGHYTEPSDPWSEELVLECHDPYTLLIAASAAVADNRLDRALTLLARGLSLAPGDARLHRQLGKTLAIRGDYAGSRRELERAVALDPANDAIRFDLLAILRRTGDDAAFARTVQDGLVASPASVGLHLEAGRLDAKAGRPDAAISHFEFSWHNGPDQPGAALELAEAYFQRDRSDDAVAVLEDALVRFPQENAALLMLVRHGIESGDARTARWLQRIVDGGAPAPLVAELRANYQRRFGVSSLP